MHDHHIKVDALTTWLSVRSRAVLDSVAHALLMLAAGVLTWRTLLYTIECHENMEVSALLLIPLWQPVILMVPSFALLAAAALYQTLTSAQLALGAQP